MPATLAQLAGVRSQEAETLAAYYQAVISSLDKPKWHPTYMGERRLADLLIPPDVLKTEPRREREERGGRPGASPTEGPGPSQEPLPHETRIGPQALDAGDEPHRAGREQTERRVAWQQEQRTTSVSPAWRAVVLGPSGQGKSVLAEMTARQLAEGALGLLRNQRAPLHELPLPVVVRLGRLATYEIGKREGPEEALRSAVQALLHQDGMPETWAAYVAAHLHEARSWVLLDGLDEVDPRNEVLGRFLAVLGQWPCRTLITARPYGYGAWRLPFPVVEYRLAPLTLEQARGFMRNWYRGGPAEARMLELLNTSPSFQEIAQNPYLLTLACAAGEEAALPKDITRTQLYERIMPLALGGEDRAADWTPLLQELAWAMVLRNSRSPRVEAAGLLDRIRDSDRRPAPLDSPGGLSAQEKAGLLRDELRQKRILAPAGRDLYEFPHRSIAAFLAAGYLAKALDRDGVSAEVPDEPLDTKRNLRSIRHIVDYKAWDPDWEQTIQFLCGLAPDAEPVLKWVLSTDDAFQTRLCLAARCLPEWRPKGVQGVLPLAEEIAATTFDLWWVQRRHRASLDAEHQHVTRSLCGVATPGILAHLANLLRDGNWDVRRAAAEAVGRFGPAAATEPFLARLADLLRDEDSEVRRFAAEAVGRFGPAAATELILARLADLLCDEDGRVRSAAAEAVGRLSPAAATELILARLTDLLRDEAPGVDWSAAEAMAGLGPAAATEPVLARLADFLRNEVLRVRWVAAKAVSGLGPAAATEPIRARLADLLRDEDHWVRSTAAEAVGRLGPAAATELILARLADLLRDEDWDVSSAAAEAVGGLGPAAGTEQILARLADLLSDWEVSARSAAAEAVGRIGPAAATEAFLARLADLLRDEDTDVRSAAAEGVGGLGPAAATDPILAGLADLLGIGSGTQFAAVRAVGAIGPAAATDPILIRLADLLGSYDVRSTAVNAVDALMAKGLRFFEEPGRPWTVRKVSDLAAL